VFGPVLEYLFSNMGDFDQTFIDELRTQSWALYSVGIFLIVLRM
jgi:hypothetical protein